VSLDETEEEAATGGAGRVVVLVLATAAALPAALGVPVEVGSGAWIDRAGPAFGRSRQVEERFGPLDDLVVARFCEDALSAESLAWEVELVAAVEAWPEVLGVEALSTADDVMVDALGVGDEPLLRPGWTREGVIRHPIYAGALVAPDGRAAAVLVRPRAGLRTHQLAALVDRLRAWLERHPPPGAGGAMLAGLPVQALAVADAVQADQRRTTPLAASALAALLLALLGPGPAFVACLGSIASAAVWTRAFHALIDTPVDALLALLPPLVMAVAVSTGLHLVVPACRAMRVGAPLGRALREVALPVALTVLTTVAGLSGLLFGAVPAVRRFAAFGVAGTLLAALSAAAWTWAIAPLLNRERASRALDGRGWRALDRVGVALLTLGERRRGAVRAALVLAAFASAGLLHRVQVDAHFVTALPADSPVRRAHAAIDAGLTGVLPLDVLVDVGRVPEAADVAALGRAVTELRGQPGIRHAVSLADLVALVETRAREAGESPPPADELLADLRDLDPDRYARWVGRSLDGEGLHLLRVAARQADGAVAVATAFEGPLRRALARELPGARVVIAGGTDMMAETTARVVPAVLRGVLATLPAVALLVGLSLGSPRQALAALAAVGLPLLAVYALLPLLGWSLDVGISMIACVALGIVVDDTVHIVAASRHPQAERARRAVAPILVATSASLGVAFLAFLAGGFAHTRRFGALVALVFAVALAVNLVGLPALLRRAPGPPRNGRADPEQRGAPRADGW
jgi:predicted RND superfamily exporter protein